MGEGRFRPHCACLSAVLVVIVHVTTKHYITHMDSIGLALSPHGRSGAASNQAVRQTIDFFQLLVLTFALVLYNYRSGSACGGDPSFQLRGHCTRS